MAIDWDQAVLGPVMGVFGDEVLYRPRQGAAFTLTDAVFDAEYAYVRRDANGEEVTTTSPMLGIRAAACPIYPAQNDLVDIPDPHKPGQYVVKDVRPDSHGHLVLLLNYRQAL